MHKLDEPFLVRIAHIAVKVALQEFAPELMESIAESWKAFGKKEFTDKERVKEEFHTLFTFHSALALKETASNDRQKLENEIESKKKEVDFWTQKYEPYKKRTDDSSESKKVMLKKKVENMNKDLQRLSIKLKEIGDTKSEDTDKLLGVMDKSIKDFIAKLYDYGWGIDGIRKIVNQAVIGSGYSTRHIKQWIK